MFYFNSEERSYKTTEQGILAKKKPASRYVANYLNSIFRDWIRNFRGSNGFEFFFYWNSL